jgi:drug/metabolite transporter (DMT)-like permease
MQSCYGRDCEIFPFIVGIPSSIQRPHSPAVYAAVRHWFNALPKAPRAIGLMVFATFILSVMLGVIRYMSFDLHPFEVVFFRNLFGLIVLLPLILRTGTSPLRTRRIGLHSARGFLQAGSMCIFFYGLSLTTLAKVAALNFTAPLFASVAAVLFLRESLSFNRAFALVVGFLGTLIILRPGIAVLNVGATMILTSAMIWGIVLIMIKRLSTTESSLTITFYMMLYLTPLTFIAAVFVWEWPTLTQLGLLVTVGCCGTLGHLAMAQALKDADTTAVMPFDFGRLIWSGLIGFVFFAEVPDVWTLVGAVVIFSAAMYVAVQESRRKETASPP